MHTFKDLEQAGWTEKALAYDDHFVPITRQAIYPILDALGDLADRDLLDIACGTGDLAQVAAGRSARVTGVDFAPTMVDVPASKVLGARSATPRPSNSPKRPSMPLPARSACGTWPSPTGRSPRRRGCCGPTVGSHSPPGCRPSRASI